MKVGELMIGDLVNIYTSPNDNPKQEDLLVAKILGVNCDELNENPIPFCEGRILSTRGVFSSPIDTLIPIPLTEKILKLNGFVYDDYTGGRHDLCYCMIPNEQMTITITKFGSKDKRGHYECHKVIIDRNGDIYVHELQHALRICGLNELADNFKIE